MNNSRSLGLGSHLPQLAIPIDGTRSELVRHRAPMWLSVCRRGCAGRLGCFRTPRRTAAAAIWYAGRNFGTSGFLPAKSTRLVILCRAELLTPTGAAVLPQGRLL